MSFNAEAMAPSMPCSSISGFQQCLRGSKSYSLYRFHTFCQNWPELNESS